MDVKIKRKRKRKKEIYIKKDALRFCSPTFFVHLPLLCISVYTTVRRRKSKFVRRDIHWLHLFCGMCSNTHFEERKQTDRQFCEKGDATHQSFDHGNNLKCKLAAASDTTVSFVFVFSYFVRCVVHAWFAPHVICWCGW
jgi:hypothetical protein